MAFNNKGTNGYFEIPTELLKDQYEEFNESVLRRRPALVDIFPKNTGHSGNVYTFTVQYGLGGGISSKDYQAWDNVTNQPYAKFLVDTVDLYGATKIHTKELLATRNDEGAYIRLFEKKGKDLYTNFYEQISIDVLKKSSEARATVGSAAAGVVVLDAGAARFFEIRQVIEYGPAGAAPAGEARVIALDSVANTITLADVADDATEVTPTAGDELYLVGDWQNSAVITAGDSNKMLGLFDWIPKDSPVVGENFLGVDRSKDPVRLAGTRLDFSAGPLVGITSPFEQVQKLATAMVLEGGLGDVLVCGPRFHEALRLELDKQGGIPASVGHQSSLKVSRGQATAHFSDVSIYTGAGMLTTFVEPRFPADCFMILNTEDWEHMSMGELPMNFDYAGSKIETTERTQNLVMRCFGYHNLICLKPVNQGIAKIA